MFQYRRIYGVRASMFPAILTHVSHHNKLPLQRVARMLILVETIRHESVFEGPQTEGVGRR